MKQNMRRRILAGVLALIWLCMAITAGVQATIALVTGAKMSDWKNGTMTYQWGFTLMGIFLVFSVLPIYIALKPQSRNGAGVDPVI